MKNEFEINEKVFVISNEPYNGQTLNLLIVGEIVEFQEIHNKFYPVVEWHNEKHLCFGIILSYNKELETTLLKLSWFERWNLLSRGMSFISFEDAAKKEKNIKRN